MAFAPSEPIADPGPPIAVKFVIAGGFGVGKTTFVGSVSEITPVRTEATMTDVGRAVDDTSLVPMKESTTVAMDFGRITVDDGLALYLFGTPGQMRFGFMWDDIVEGALGALVLVDPRRIDDCFAALDYFEEQSIPFVVVLNHFESAHRPDVEAVRYALNVAPEIPFVDCDARDKESVKEALLTMLDHLLDQLTADQPGAASTHSSPDR